MQSALKAGAAYFILVFIAGFLLGTLRMMLLIPMFGEIIAVLIELPAMLAVSWFTCRWLLRRFDVAPRPTARLIMGLSAFGYLMLAETLLATTMFGQSPQEFLATFSQTAAQLGLAGQVIYALMPLFARPSLKR